MFSLKEKVCIFAQRQNKQDDLKWMIHNQHAAQQQLKQVFIFMSVLYSFSKRDIKWWHIYIENILICYK